MWTSSEISKKIGMIVTNLQSLEFALRLFLDEAQGYAGNVENVPVNLTNLTVGEWVPENYFTNFDTLRQLIRKINSELNYRGCSEQVDESLIVLRDAIAHGRVLANLPYEYLHLVKFSKPFGGKTQVIVSVEMTPTWLDQEIKRTHDEILKVISIAQSFGFKCFPKE
jgi:hypothetical protein